MEFEKLKEIIENVLNIDPDGITMDAAFIDDLGADSLDIFQIIMGIEETFDIEIENEELWSKGADTAINRKWWDFMADIMETNPDNSPVSVDLKNVFHLD